MPVPIDAVIDKPWADELRIRSACNGVINFCIPAKARKVSKNNYGVSQVEADEMGGLLIS